MTGAELVQAERQRQIDVEGFTPEHDAQHTDGQLVEAAFCYAAMAGNQLFNGAGQEQIMDEWPWEEEWWKPADNPVRNLVKSAALICAEIDRLRRKTQ